MKKVFLCIYFAFFAFLKICVLHFLHFCLSWVLCLRFFASVFVPSLPITSSVYRALCWLYHHFMHRVLYLLLSTVRQSLFRKHPSMPTAKGDAKGNAKGDAKGNAKQKSERKKKQKVQKNTKIMHILHLFCIFCIICAFGFAAFLASIFLVHFFLRFGFV